MKAPHSKGIWATMWKYWIIFNQIGFQPCFASSLSSVQFFCPCWKIPGEAELLCRISGWRHLFWERQVNIDSDGLGISPKTHLRMQRKIMSFNRNLLRPDLPQQSHHSEHLPAMPAPVTTLGEQPRTNRQRNLTSSLDANREEVPSGAQRPFPWK